MTSLSQPLPQFAAKSFLPYELPVTYSNMPHLSHTSLMSPLVNPFVSSNILNMLQDEMKFEKQCATLRPFQIYDPSDPITALSVPTNDFSRSCDQLSSSSSSTQVTSSTSDNDTSPVTPIQTPHRNVIVRNENVRKKKELVKDEAYWERRRKNNDAAKRSRDSRRQKEDEMAVRAAVLEQENLRLRLEVEQLRAETERLRVLMLSPSILPAPTPILTTQSAIIHTPQPVIVAAPSSTTTNLSPSTRPQSPTPIQAPLSITLPASSPPTQPQQALFAQ